MKIAIEAQRIFRRDKHGMDFVILETLRELQKRKDGNKYYVIVAPGEDQCLKESENFSIIELKCPSYPLWEQIALPQVVHRLKVDILHCTSNTAPLWCSVPLVLTLHDIIYLEPRKHHSLSFYQELGWYYRKLIVPRILNKCKRIITVSHFECDRIRKTLQLPDKQVTTIYNGYNVHFEPLKSLDNNIIHKYVQQDGFIFFLGNTDPKKNAVNTLKAYSLYLTMSTVKRPLLIADLKEEYIDIILQQENITEIKKKLRFPGYIANIDLVTLYNAAFAFLYPSLRESFGIPILEAMACGTPIITSSTSAMPEVAGEKAILINPQQPQEIANAVIRLENDSNFYKQQQKYGLERASHFSWRKTAEDYFEIYKEVQNLSSKL